MIYNLDFAYFRSFSGGSDGKESACNAGDLGWEDPLENVCSLGWEDPMENGYPLQYCCLENSMDKGA